MTSIHDGGDVATIGTRHLFTIDIDVQHPNVLGDFPHGERRLVVFDRGTFTGPGVSGTLAAGGVDWQHVRPDGVVEIDAHYLLVTDEGENIEVHSQGVRSAAPEVAARMLRGEIPDPSEYYFRTFIRLSSSAPRWTHLNGTIALSRGRRKQGGVVIEVHEVL